MAAGDRIFMAKESTSQEILSNTKKIIEDAKAKPKRYGMRINLLDSNPATRVKYLYDAVGMTPAGMNFAGGGFDYGDWGDIWFVKKNRPVMVRTDGTVDYELNHENHALKLNGGASDITKTSYGGNAMSEIPLIWVKRWTQNNYHFVVFCEEQYDDTYKAYAHTDADGNVLPVTYFPMYEGSVVNSRMRSLSGLTPTASMTDEQETTAAKQNGDRWGQIWPATTDYFWYSPIDGQRVILYFNPLYDNYPEGYDCSVKVLNIKEILTKPIEELTAENEEAFGNDPVDIFEGNMWISGGYLNIIFNQNMPSKMKHLVSLVKNTTITPVQDGYIHLEYRYNTYADTTGYWRNGAVSFNLKSLKITSETKGIKVKINSAKNGEKEVSFDLKETPSPVGLSQMDFSQMEIK